MALVLFPNAINTTTHHLPYISFQEASKYLKNKNKSHQYCFSTKRKNVISEKESKLKKKKYKKKKKYPPVVFKVQAVKESKYLNKRKNVISKKKQKKLKNKLKNTFITMLLMVWTYIGQLVRFQQTTRLFLSNRRRNIISNISIKTFLSKLTLKVLQSVL